MTNKEVDNIISTAIFLFSTTALASSPLGYIGLHACELSITIGLNYLAQNQIISKKTHNILRITAGGLAYAASNLYCRPYIESNLSFHILTSAIASALSSGLIPTATSNLIINLSEEILPSTTFTAQPALLNPYINKHYIYSMNESAKRFCTQFLKNLAKPADEYDWFKCKFNSNLIAYFLTTLLYKGVGNKWEFSYDVITKSTGSILSSKVACLIKDEIFTTHLLKPIIFDPMYAFFKETFADISQKGRKAFTARYIHNVGYHLSSADISALQK